MRFILATTALALTFGTGAAAFAQSAPTLTKQQARYDAAAAGYSYISHLKQTKSGAWTGEGHQGAFTVMPDGKVVAQK
jgi:hypothetical protein